jgi:hypothetical protein
MGGSFRAPAFFCVSTKQSLSASRWSGYAQRARSERSNRWSAICRSWLCRVSSAAFGVIRAHPRNRCDPWARTRSPRMTQRGNPQPKVMGAVELCRRIVTLAPGTPESGNSSRPLRARWASGRRGRMRWEWKGSPKGFTLSPKDETGVENGARSYGNRRGHGHGRRRGQEVSGWRARRAGWSSPGQAARRSPGKRSG